MTTNKCRSCGEPLSNTFCDLGMTPISNALIKREDAGKGETFYPLHVSYCPGCWLVQLDESPDSDAHFHGDYVYFSSFSPSWLAHARKYVDDISTRFGIGPHSHVIELASNDGYLLQYFVAARVPCLGIEPTANTAAAAREKGVETREAFFGRQTAQSLANEGRKADLLIGNNVLAHVPDINDFVGGMPCALKPEGVITLEFPHLVELIAHNQFDTIYHEHFSYLSLTALMPILARAGLRAFHVEALPTHGGSLRLYACHASASHAKTAAVGSLLERERVFGLTRRQTYDAFGARVRVHKRQFMSFILDASKQNKTIAAYGAAAKGNTLLNYCGIGRDFISFVADKNPTKQGRLLPGTRIPVVAPEQIFQERPDYLIILPWNLRSEIINEMAAIRSWGGQFVVPIPTVEIVP